jgi:hypothetical protein
MSDEAKQSPEEWFHRKATDFVESQILYHLNRVGVWHVLRQGPQSAHDLALSLSLVPEVLGILLEYVVGVDRLLEHDDEGRFALTSFGRDVLARYGREGQATTTYNFFDVRVGSYGPVWAQLGSLLKGEVAYGRDLKRDGDRAEKAVYTVGKRLENGFLDILDSVAPEVIVELGVTSGLLNIVGTQRPAVSLVGMDRKEAALERAAAKASEEGVDDVKWLLGDLFELDSWMPESMKHRKGLLFSVHFHEFLAAGVDKVQTWLRTLSEELPGWTVVAIEQPSLPSSARGTVTEAAWLYNHSNILIHHLIGNGHILSDARWKKLFSEAGCEVEAIHPMQFLGYCGYVFRL